MRPIRPLTALASLAAASATLVVAAPPAAHAGVATAVNGTILTITATGNADVDLGCTGGLVSISNVAPVPSISCAAVTKVQVNGDGGAQRVWAEDLDGPAFTSNPVLSVALGNGTDTVIDTKRADSLSLGGDLDRLRISAGSAPNVVNDLGPGSDYVEVQGSAGTDAIVATSSSSTLALAVTAGGGPVAHSVANVEGLLVWAGDGDDTVDATGITAASTVANLQLHGQGGDDVLSSAVVASVLVGGAGANQLTGSTKADTIFTESHTDTIAPGTGVDGLIDRASLFSGGRTIVGGGGPDDWSTLLHPGDVTARLRPTGGGTTRLVASLTRPGIQQLPDAVDFVEVSLADDPQPDDRGLVDIVLTPGVDYQVHADAATNDLVDVTVPVAGWTLLSQPGDHPATVVQTTSALYGDVDVDGTSKISVHGPWTNPQRGFAHRVTRDLLFRFATTATLDDLQAQLTAGTLTRSALVASYVDSDEYRGLDVDRTFVDYLRRPSDPSGRAYWIDSLGDGKPLWRFRAQLFGSNEYFTKAGGTNASFVQRAYQDVLGRTPDPSGAAYWTAKLAGGTDRGSVALQFLDAAEARRRLVDDQYLRFLDRKPSDGERTTWAAALRGATGEQDLIAALAASAEYLARD